MRSQNHKQYYTSFCWTLTSDKDPSEPLQSKEARSVFACVVKGRGRDFTIDRKSITTTSTERSKDVYTVNEKGKVSFYK